MASPEAGSFNPESKGSPVDVAKEKWNIDLDQDAAVIEKLVELGGQMPDVAELGNLWRDHQEQKEQGSQLRAA